MRKIAHISDLHFGKEDPFVVEHLIKDLSNNKPNLVIISGDFTQRARKKEFEKARALLDNLPLKTIGIPGNHDIPLFDLFRRFFFPLTRYKKYINKDVNPTYSDEEIVVYCLNTARSLAWKEGRISVEQINEIKNTMCLFPDNMFKIVVTHHPFIPPPHNPGIKLVGRSTLALDEIDQCNVDLLLAGHLHLEYSGDVMGFYVKRKRSVIAVQAGTAVSVRTRGETNSYNLITIVQNRIDIQVREWSGKMFVNKLLTSYEKKGNVWKHIKKVVLD